MILHAHPGNLRHVAQAVLYGVWPMFFAGAGITWAYRWFRMKAIDKFKDPTIDRSKLKKIHRFSSVEEVSLLCRAMRQFDLDGVIDSDAADLGELVIKVRRCSNSFSRRPCVCVCVHSCRHTQAVRMPYAGHTAEIVLCYAVRRIKVWCL